MNAEEKVRKIAKVLFDKKAADIRAIRVRDLTTLADYFVFASGTSTTQVRALTEEVEFRLSELGVEPNRVEGRQTNNWLILDYGDVVVHIFHTETRAYYDLERLWSDGEEVDLGDLN